MSSLNRFCAALAAAFMFGLMFFGAQPTVQAQSTTIVISEFRTRGPLGANDEFVEVTNISASPVDISGYTLRGSNNAATVSVRSTVPAATAPLPPGGHYLFVNDQATGTNEYSLTAYAAGNAIFTTGVTDDGGVAIFAADGTTIVDQVGMSAGSAYKEGTTLAPMVADAVSDYSYVRRMVSGVPQDTNNNAVDFVLVSTDGNVGALTAVLGAPGPENLASPVQRNAAIKGSLIDPSQPSTASPNRVRSSSGANPTTAAFGTLSIQRRFTNTTPDAITRLRFRVVDITTLNSPVVTAPQADLRVLSSSGTVTNSAGTTVATVTGLTLEQPPTQPLGGGLNSSLTVIPPNGSLASGSTIDVQFLLGVQQEGNFRFLVNVEALPAVSSTPVLTNTKSATKAGATSRERSSNK